MADSVKIRIDGDDSGYQKTLEGIGKATKAGLADVKAGIDLASAALQKFSDVAKKGIGYNAQIETLKTSFEVMTGSAEKAAEVVERLRVMGAETPYEALDLANTTQLLMQYGFTADEAIDRMSMLGDIAQGSAEKMNSVALGYAQMSSAGKVNLVDIKQMINAGFNPLQEISESTGESMASLYDRISKGTMSVDEITQAMVRATSEGGKFFGSMEKQSQTLSGQLSTLNDNADQLLGTLTEGLSEDLRAEILPLANDMIGDLQEAYIKGGTEGLKNAALKMVHNLLGYLPTALRSASGAFPQIVSAFFEVATLIVTDLVSMFPEWAPILLGGVVDLIGSVLKGAEGVVEGLFTGIEQAFHKGERKIAGVWVDETRLAKYDFDIEANVDKTSVSQEIEGAKQEIINVLSGIEGIDAEQIAEAIISGDVEEALEAALIHAGVDPKAAKRVADTIEESRRIISAAIENLAINDEIIANVREMAASGATENEIAAYIEGFGVDPAVARETAAKIAESQKIISSAIAGLGLSDEAAAHIQQMIDNGESENEIAAYIESLGVDPAVAQEAAKTISGAMDVVSNAVVGLGLSEQAENTIREMVEAGATKDEIAAYIESLGIDPEVANNAAKTITDAAKTVDKSIKGLPDDIRGSIDGLEVSDEKELLVSALQMMGLDEADIKAVLASYDSTSGLLSAGITGIFSNIADTLTDGLPDTEEVLGGLEKEVRDWAHEAYDKIDAWYTSEVEKLKSEGKTGAEYDAALLDIETKANEMRAGVQEAEVGAIGFMNSMAGKSTEYVRQHLGELEAIGRAAQELSAQIDALTAAARAEGENAFNVVRSGANADEQTISMAIRYKVDEMKLDEQSAEDAYNQAVKELNAQLSAGEITQEEYDVSISGEQATLEAAKKTAREKFQNAFSEIMQGIAESEGNAEALNKAMQAVGAQLSLDEFYKYFLDGGGTVDPATTKKFTDQISAVLGDSFDPTNLTQAIERGDFAGVNDALATIASLIQPEIDESTKQALGGKVSEAWSAALESGVLTGTAFDTTSSEAQLAALFESTVQSAATTATAGVASAGSLLGKSATDAEKTAVEEGSRSAGEAIPSGNAIGMLSKKYVAVNAAGALAKAVIDKIKSVFQINSPSKVAFGIGGNFGDSMGSGLEESMSRAVVTAKRLSGQIVTAADMSTAMNVNFSGLQNEIIAANEQASTPVYLDGKQIAQIQGHNNSVQLAWDNNRSAKGVGRK